MHQFVGTAVDILFPRKEQLYRKI